MTVNNPSHDAHCQICGGKASDLELLPAVLVRPVIAGLIAKANPKWSVDGYICVDDLNRFRSDYIRSLLEMERGELSDLDREVVESLQKHEILSSNTDQDYESVLTFGEKLSDRIAAFGGSWRFISIFACILFVWLLINSIVLLFKPFDPYPYILLNLILSCLAAIQAPVIMMSQNRQESKDRLRASHDYQINLKAELEIRNLHQKIDHLLSRQWERLVEIQGIQLEVLEEIRIKSSQTGSFK
jgi:uncharacterized membrane protein